MDVAHPHTGSSQGASEAQGICAFCGAHTALRLSHIIPEFFYRPLYDEKHRMQEVRFVGSTVEKGRMPQKGIREHLLCGKCETRFSSWERVVSQILYHQPEQQEDSEHSVIYRGVSYPEMKLGLLSILWRAHAARGRTFRHVNLGEHHLRLHRMLREGDPGPSFVFPILAFVDSSGALLPMGVEEPQDIRLEGHRAYRFTMSGMGWFFIVSNHKVPESLSKFFLHEQYEFVVPKIDFRTTRLFKEIRRRVLASGLE